MLGVGDVDRDRQQQVRAAAAVEVHVMAGAQAGDGAVDAAEGREVAVVGFVAGRGEVGNALGRHRVDGLA